MPRKKNRRKEIQKAKRRLQPKPKRQVGTIAHMPYGGSGAAMAMAMAVASTPELARRYAEAIKQREGQSDG